jgi:hypothetical protein
MYDNISLKSAHILKAFLAYFTYFEKIRVGLYSHLAVCVSMCVSLHINFWIPEQIFMELATYIMAPEPISTVYTPYRCWATDR